MERTRTIIALMFHDVPMFLLHLVSPARTYRLFFGQMFVQRWVLCWQGTRFTCQCSSKAHSFECLDLELVEGLEAACVQKNLVNSDGDVCKPQAGKYQNGLHREVTGKCWIFLLAARFV